MLTLSHSQDCTLILTEGDSAKTLAVSGLGVVGRDRYGVFPLKGKLLNVREATPSQVVKNEEIQVGAGGANTGKPPRQCFQVSLFCFAAAGRYQAMRAVDG